MMKIARFFSMILICAFPPRGNAQINFVFNPSFENYSHCPYSWNQIALASYWNGIDSSWNPLDSVIIPPPCLPELVDECSPSIYATVPNNIDFNHHTHTGEGMAQVIMYYNEANPFYTPKRDYLQGRLKTHLLSGYQYEVTFFTTLEQSSAYKINHIGAYLDDGIIDTTANCGWPQPDHIPQVYETSLIDSGQWVKVQGTFTATGSERFITIGNLFDANHTDTVRVYFPMAVGAVNTWFSFYLIDDVSVIDCASNPFAGHDTSINAHDSVWVGTQDGYLPCWWYKDGVLVDSNTAGFWVHPDTVTKYVMEMNICGTVKYDTVTISIADTAISHVGVGLVVSGSGIKTYPNPASSVLNLSGLVQNTVFQLQSVSGSVLKEGILKKGADKIVVKDMVGGVYLLVLFDEDGGKVVRRVVKE